MYAGNCFALQVNEHRAYWFENEKIVIKTDSSEVSTDYYVYEFTG